MENEEFSSFSPPRFCDPNPLLFNLTSRALELILLYDYGATLEAKCLVNATPVPPEDHTLQL